MNCSDSLGNAEKLCLQILRESDNLFWKIFVFINDIAARRLSTVQYCLRTRGLLAAAKMRVQNMLNRKIVLTSKWSLLLLVILECLSTVWAMPPPLTATPNCSSVIQIFESYGINKAEVPKSPLSGKNLRYCETSTTCCTPGMEIKFLSSLRLHLEKSIKDNIGKLASVLGNRATKFNDFFEKLLTESKKEFHIMFKKTYGVLYEQNSYVFSDFFTELEKYYSRGKVDLAEAIDSFFNTLYQKMFTVLNAQYSFNDKYLGCVSEHMKELKPFGDVPDKLSVQIKRSFVATRTYAQALMTAAEVAKKVMNIRPSENCTAALMRMQYCSSCKGYIEKPCANYCENVLKGCLHYFHDLDIEWDNFVSSMEKVSERLLGPFNIVVVVEPINIKISEAIMNFQETGQDISNQVFQGCGRPVLGRRQRSIDTKPIKPENIRELSDTNSDIVNIDDNIDDEIIIKDRVLRSANEEKDAQYVPAQTSSVPDEQADVKSKKRSKKKQSNRKESEDEEVSREPVLNKLVKDIRQRVKDSKKFWYNLPYQICSNEHFAAPPETDKPCWNGVTVDSYTHPIASDHTINPEFPSISANSRQSSLVGNQLYYLKTAVSHLRNAYNGLDVEWSDQDEPYYGSGSGSGEGMDDVEGSGMNPYDEVQPHIPEHVDTPSVRVHTATGTTVPNATGKYTPDRDGKISTKVNAAAKMSLRQALITYLFPIYVAWFGGIISDIL